MARPSFAQMDTYFDTYIAPEERAVFAFFRVAGIIPDYESWIKPGERYRSLSPQKQEEFLLKEMLRLGRGYGLYDVTENPLELKTNVLARYIPAVGAKPARITFRFSNHSEGDIPTFNYPYGRNEILLLINNFQIFADISLNAQQNEALLKKIPYEEEDFDAVLSLHVRVSGADSKKPVRQDSHLQWLMTGDVAYMKCEVHKIGSGEGALLWDYVAPWYAEQFRLRNMSEEEKAPHPYDLFKD